MRRVANRRLFVGLFARVVRSNTVLPKETMDAESSEVLEMWEGEFGEGRDSEWSESGESGVVTYSASEPVKHILTPDRPRTVVRPIDLPALNCRN